MKDTFKKIIINFQEAHIAKLIEREYNLPLQSKKIISLVGVRRCGKTSLLLNLINTLRKTIDSKNILYINFEDDRLFPLELKNLDLILQAYYELYPEKQDEKIYLFLDEVQVVEHWELYVRRIYDTQNIQLFITGSSSKLLSTEMATSLRGRTLTYEIFPFSFKEYLSYQQIEVNLYSSKSLSYIQNALQSYLDFGGFAETISEDNEIKRRILSDYLNLIMFKDVVDRYNVKNRSLLKHLLKYCFTNMSTLVSFTKLFNEYKSQGYKISKDTLFDYFSYLDDAYALFSVPIFRNSIKEEQRHPKKIYAVDNGFKKIFDFSLSKDMSKLYENIVFLHLRRKTKEIYYFKEKQEVDFYVKIDAKQSLINVSYQLSNQETKQREINGLVEAMNYFNLDEAILINEDQNDEIRVNNKVIKCIPLYQWLLQ
jgi:uncharacterized protein